MTTNDLGSVSYDAIVLAGGAGKRLGGVDKPALEVAGVSLLDRALAACSQARTVVVVGYPRPTSRPVRWTVERPLRGGPLAGLGAGLEALRPDVESVVVLAADMPYLKASDVARTVSALPGHDAAVFADETGTLQPLAAAYAAGPLAAAVAALGELRHQPVRRVLDELRTVTVAGRGATQDCDTHDQLEAARRALR